MEIEAVIDPRKASQVGIRVLSSPDGREQTTISLSNHGHNWAWRTLMLGRVPVLAEPPLPPDARRKPPG